MHIDDGQDVYEVFNGENDSNLFKLNSWKKDEDDMLRMLVEHNGTDSWLSISRLMEGKTELQCKKRWETYLDPDLIKGPWTRLEDDKLTELVEEFGRKKWSYIATYLKGRTGKQCRERWHNHLNPEVNKAAWSKDEDLLLYEMHKIHGNKWAKIAKYFNGRTDNSIKNHWHGTVRRRYYQKNTPGPCGSPNVVALSILKRCVSESGNNENEISSENLISQSKSRDARSTVINRNTCSLEADAEQNFWLKELLSESDSESNDHSMENLSNASSGLNLPAFKTNASPQTATSETVKSAPEIESAWNSSIGTSSSSTSSLVTKPSTVPSPLDTSLPQTPSSEFFHVAGFSPNCTPQLTNGMNILCDDGEECQLNTPVHSVELNNKKVVVLRTPVLPRFHVQTSSSQKKVSDRLLGVKGRILLQQFPLSANNLEMGENDRSVGKVIEQKGVISKRTPGEHENTDRRINQIIPSKDTAYLHLDRYAECDYEAELLLKDSSIELHQDIEASEFHEQQESESFDLWFKVACGMTKTQEELIKQAKQFMNATNHSKSLKTEQNELVDVEK
ncbi:hypothetical protein HELRODRAFT_194177 [Helobdella robusta]|uniref:Uncharacterized protein n=1 Tax=Helobdella robusta TaxID=6412 RepID=T1FVS2_HELRO|nr:hypothetical protein HELRODRAFT_194177 [Helobdella robusta]ESN93169.1 hypothetical protein HELRODRAFT_194177 [Helobdella robusta]